MTPPARLKIGAHTYKVARVREIEGHPDRVGQMTARSSMIELIRDQSASVLRDTVLHEVIHACFAHGPHGLSYEGEENVTELLTPLLLGALRDNPNLVKFLLDKEA